MTWRKKIALGLAISFVAIQFIQPARNKNNETSENDITMKYRVPGNVLTVLQTSCYDCHSNNTNYPWYSRIQPFGWFLERHIKKGKAELNFSEFNSYTTRRTISKLRE